MGYPKIVLSDHGTQFTSTREKENLGWEGITLGYSAIYNPRLNVVERITGELGRIFQAFCYKKHMMWTEYVKEAENV